MFDMKNIRFLSLIFISVITVVGCKSKPSVKTELLPVLSADDIKSITQREISTWEFGKIKSDTGLRAILADDYQAVFGKVILSKEDVIGIYNRSNIRDYNLSNIKVKPIAQDVAIIYYELHQNVTDPNGDRWPAHVAPSVTYVKRDNVWRSVYYIETELKP